MSAFRAIRVDRDEGGDPRAAYVVMDDRDLMAGDVELDVGVHGSVVLSGWLLHRCTPDGMKWQLCHMA